MRRRCRKQTRHTAWYDEVTSLPAQWDVALPADHFLRSASLAAHERAALPHLKTIYTAVWAGEIIIAQAAFQVLTLQQEHLSPAALKGIQRVAWRLFAGALKPKLLVAGQLFRHDVVSCWWSAELTPFEAFNIYRGAIGEALKKTCAQAVLVKDCPQEFVPYFQHHAPEYLLLRNDISMQLALPGEWETLVNYEQHLKHKYAQRLRKVRQAWAGLEVRELDADAVSTNAAILFDLYLQVAEHQPVRLGLLSQQFLPELKLFYGDKLKIWGVYEAGRMIAFTSAWVQEGSYDMFYIGFDYSRNAELQLYFNILFFAVEQAIALHKPRLILGRTALEAKARLGCRPEYLHTFLYITNPLLRNMVRRLQLRFTEGAGEWEQRHPFRKE